MNKIKQTLKSMNIQSLLDNDSLNTEIIFSEDFAAFDGHFPGNKLLPGFVHILVVIFILESFFNTKFSLKEIIQSKFKSPVFPLEKTLININISNLNEKGLVTAKLTDESVQKSTFKIIIQKES